MKRERTNRQKSAFNRFCLLRIGKRHGGEEHFRKNEDKKRNRAIEEIETDEVPEIIKDTREKRKNKTWDIVEPRIETASFGFPPVFKEEGKTKEDGTGNIKKKIPKPRIPIRPERIITESGKTDTGHSQQLEQK